MRLIEIRRWRLHLRRAARTEPEPCLGDDLLRRRLEWDAVVNAALQDDEIVGGAHVLDVPLSELRSELSFESAVLAVTDALPDIRALERGECDPATLEQARTELRLQVCRQLGLALARRADLAYAVNLAIDTTTDLANHAFALRQEVISSLRTTCADMTQGGSVGIVGPSGSGKTRLINEFCGPTAHSGDPRVLCTVVTAGTRYDALDFVRHLLGRLCQEALDGSATEDAKVTRGPVSPGWKEDRTKTQWRRIGAVLAWGGASLIVIGAFNVRADPLLIAGTTCLILAAAISRAGASATASDSALRVAIARRLRKGSEQLPLIGVGVVLIAASQFGTTVDPLVVIGAISLAIASSMRGPPRALRRLMSSPGSSGSRQTGFPRSLVTTARSVLDQLEHNRTVSTSETRAQGATLGRRLALRFGKSSDFSEKFTPRAWTLPDALRRLAQFVYEDAGELDIWIGIDLQRMEPDASRAFLADIDPVLRLKRARCFVLVSILGDMSRLPAARERCDHVVPLAPLGFPDSRGLLCRGGTGLSMPFAALCHVLSGGIPTSLVEHACALVQSKPEADDGRMSDLARALVTPRLQLHADEIHAQALRDGNQISTDVLDWVRGVRSRCASPDALLRHLELRPDLLPDDRSQPAAEHALDAAPDSRIQWLADGLAAHCYFAATVLAFFDDELSRAAVDNALHGEPSPLEILCEARTAISINPTHASRLIREFRVRCALEPEGT